MGNPFSSSKPVQGDVKVWGEQAPYLKQGFKEAQGIYGSQKGTPFYSGPLYAGLQGGGQDLVSQARALLSKANLSSDTVGGFGNDIIGTAGRDLKSLLGKLNAGPNGALEAGNAYAHSDVANGLIDSSSRDVVRNLNEETLPALNLNAIGTGNMNSSRVGAREGILTRGAQDRIADISSGVRGALFDRGVNEYGANLDRTASTVMGSLGAGSDFLSQMFQLGSGANTELMKALGVEQADRQGATDEAFKQWSGQDTRASDILNRFWQIVGGNIGQTPGMANKQTTGWFSAMFPQGIMGG